MVMSVDEFIKHHGVKGMKWGVRKDRGHEGQKATNKKIGKLDKKFERRANTPGRAIAAHNTAATAMNKTEINRINNKAAYKNADFTRDTPLRRKYYAEHQKAYMDQLEKALGDMGTNASGTKKYGILEVGEQGHWKIVTKDVAHDSVDPVEIDITVHYDPKGRIISVEPQTDNVIAQWATATADEILEHHGVKGMRWGVRKDRGGSSRKSGGGSDGPSHPKPHTLSDEELKKAIDRMQLEKQYKDLVSPPAPPKKKSEASDFIKEMGKGLAKDMVKAVSTQAINKAVAKK